MANQKEQFQSQFDSFINSFNSGADKVVTHFTEDATIIYPYYAEIPAKMNISEYHAQLTGILPNMQDFTCTDYKIYATDESGTYWATVNAKCFIPFTDKTYEQHYVMCITVNQAFKITHYVEYGNPLLSQKAFTKDEVMEK